MKNLVTWKNFNWFLIAASSIQLFFPNLLTWSFTLLYLIFLNGVTFLMFGYFAYVMCDEGLSINDFFKKLKKYNIDYKDNKISLNGFIYIAIYVSILLSFGSAGYTGILYFLAVLLLIPLFLCSVFFYKIKHT